MTMTADSMSEELLLEVSGFVERRMGLLFERGKLPELARGVRAAAGDFGFKDAEACARWLLSSPLTGRQVEVLASRLTVGETYFFRDQRLFELLEHEVLPGLLRERGGSGKRLKIWSAGCCTGEEPYSVAMLLDRLVGDRRDWNITVLATDINPVFLKKASIGVYGKWSFREVHEGIRERYFTRTPDGLYELLPRIRNRVTFAYHNLVENAYPSLLTNTNAMDVILCRNVLMYLTPGHQARIAEKLFRCLTENGWLAVSPSELSFDLFSRYETTNLKEMTFYRKKAKHGLTEGRVVAAPGETKLPAASATVESVPNEAPAARRESVVPATAEQSGPGPAEAPKEPYAEARALYEAGRYGEVERIITASMAEGSAPDGACLLLAKASANRGRLDDALAWTRKAMASDKLDPAVYHLLAMVHEEMGNLDDATQAIKQALYLDRNFALAYFVLANLDRRQGRTKEAAKNLENAADILVQCSRDAVLDQTDGVTAGRLLDIIHATTVKEKTQ